MLRVSMALAGALALAGCTGATTPPPQTAAPAPVVAPAAPAPAGAPAAATPAPAAKPAVSGALLGPVGQGLDQKDLDSAFKAQVSALDSGKRTSWRGQKGTFGYVEVGSEGGLTGTCRDYTHVVYVGGRPRNGKGTACKGSAGEWTTTS
jgi:surface antigen